MSTSPFAIVSIAGFQEKVEEGMKLRVPHLGGEAGRTLKFQDVLLLVGGEGGVTLGKPFVPGVSIEAKVLSHGKAEKIRVFKMRRRKRFRRTHGHRQLFSEIEVTKIVKGSEEGLD